MNTMLVILGVGLASGLPISRAVAIGLTLLQPAVVLTSALAFGMASRGQRRDADHEIAVLATIAGDLRAGRSLRHALGGSAGTGTGPRARVARLATLGLPLRSLEGDLRAAFPGSASLLVPAVGMLEATGGSAAAVFELLAESHAMQVGVERELRAALAPARLSAGLLTALTAAALAWITGTGRLGVLLADPAGRILGIVGAALIGCGLAAFVVMLRRGSAA